MDDVAIPVVLLREVVSLLDTAADYAAELSEIRGDSPSQKTMRIRAVAIELESRISRAAPVTDGGKWRDIPLDQIDWFANSTGKTRHPARILHFLSHKTGDSPYQIGNWHGWTLGKLADAGERKWAREASIGPVCILIIKEIIDRAAAGESVTETEAGPGSYVPQPWPRPEGGAS